MLTVAVTGAAFVAAAVATEGTPLAPWEAVLLGLVEGTTEYLPVSSTAHLLVTGRLLGLGDGAEGSALGTYVVAIQIGAIAAVVGLYRHRLGQMARGVAGTNAEGLGILFVVAVAFAPAALLGAVAGSSIRSLLFHPWPIVLAWGSGGLLLLLRPASRAGALRLEAVAVSQALLIGVAQVGALWPGVSRSLVTLLAGLALGLTVRAAIELTFLLGFVTLTAATAWDLARHGPELIEVYGLATPALGILTAFSAGFVSARWMTDRLDQAALPWFGAYRLLAAAATTTLLATGVL